MGSVVEFPEKVMQDALTWPLRAVAHVIEDPVTYVRASEFLLDIKRLRKEVDAAFDPIISKAHEAHREACAQKKKAEAPLAEAEQILKRGLVAWDTEQERLRREEEQRLQERARVEEEARRAQEAAALETAANATGDESLRAEAEQLINEPSAAPAIALPRSTPKVAGLSYRENWTAQVIDLRALCRAIADGQQPTTLVVACQPALNQLARALKAQLRVPGVKAVCEKIASAGR